MSPVVAASSAGILRKKKEEEEEEEKKKMCYILQQNVATIRDTGLDGCKLQVLRSASEGKMPCVVCRDKWVCYIR